jgi:hypothetical protein
VVRQTGRVDDGHDCVLWRLPHHLPPILGTPRHRRLEHGSYGPPPQGYRAVYTRGHTLDVLALGGMRCSAISAAKRAALGSPPLRELCWVVPYRVSRHTAWHHHQRPVRALSRTLETQRAPRDDPSRNRGRTGPHRTGWRGPHGDKDARQGPRRAS